MIVVSFHQSRFRDFKTYYKQCVFCYLIISELRIRNKLNIQVAIKSFE
ncbi:hypothetical protein [Candidatus Enterovibrio escicola]|nr:hypothetical protein [Candidatus Enterovibrio escacola]